MKATDLSRGKAGGKLAGRVVKGVEDHVWASIRLSEREYWSGVESQASSSSFELVTESDCEEVVERLLHTVGLVELEEEISYSESEEFSNR